MKDMNVQKKIIDVVRNKKTQLPTLPTIVNRILGIVNDPDSSATDLAEVVSRDQAIANKIIRLANSSYYGFARQINSIPLAISVIGYNEIVSLALGVSVFSALRLKQTQTFFDVQGLWRHAIGVATAGRMLGRRIPGNSVSEQIFLTGLFHDIGKIFFIEYFPDDYRAVSKSDMLAERSLHQVEKEMMGIDHATLGGMLMEQWNFPGSIVVPVRYHHRSSLCPQQYQDDARIVELADNLCHAACIGSSGNAVAGDGMSIAVPFGLDEAGVQALVGELKSQAGEIEKFFDLIR